MPYQKAILHAAAADLRTIGWRVDFHPGWATRGVSDFDPVGLIWHHTASSAGSSGLSHVVGNNHANAFLPRDNWRSQHGDVRIVAAGTAFHGGQGIWNGVSGNRRFWGVEAENNGVGEVWSARMLDVYHDLSAALARRTAKFANDVHMLCAHHEYATPRGRKIDPWGPPICNCPWPMAARRAAVRALVPGPPRPRARLPRPGVLLFMGATSPIHPAPAPPRRPDTRLPRPGVRLHKEEGMFIVREQGTPHWYLVRPGPADGMYSRLPQGTGDPVARFFGGRSQVPEWTMSEIRLFAGVSQPTPWRPPSRS